MIENHLKEIFRLSEELSEMTGQPFTPDGFLIGSAGEFYAKHLYGIELHENVTQKATDGSWRGIQVQIKATGKKSVILSGQTDKLLVVKINRDGSHSVIYNGNGDRPWKFLVSKSRKASRQGISIQLSHLAILDKQVLDSERMYRS